MRRDKIVRTTTVDCENCYKEVEIEVAYGDRDIPEGWIEVSEGPPFNNKYQFCTLKCFSEWHNKDKNERLTEYHDRLRAKQEEQRIAEEREQ